MEVHTLGLGLLCLLRLLRAFEIDNSASVVRTHSYKVPSRLEYMKQNALNQEEHIQKLTKLVENECQKIEDVIFNILKVQNNLDLSDKLPEKLDLTEAKQSSTSDSHGAHRAIDGRKRTTFSKLSCTHTSDWQYSRPYWWQAKLTQPTIVYQVGITNRGDCCGYRLKDFEVRGFDEDPEKEQTPKICKKYRGKVETGATEIITCDKPIEALYLRLILMTTSWTVLTICEFEAFGIKLPENWKVLTNAMQSSNDYEETESKAWRALDEDPQTCTHTDAEKDNDAWWELDLRQTKTVVSVTLTNRNDDKAKWLQDIEVSVHEHRPSSCTEDEATTSSLCARQKEAVGQGEELTLTCTTPVTGRYLRVTKKRRAGEALSLCDVVVKTED